ncbi:MAG: hypothetical protein U0X73_12385 [Thermoanaerobaculia bacterium]
MPRRKVAGIAILCLTSLLAASSQALAAASMALVNMDGPGEGLNDPAPCLPTATNPATTLGGARLNAVQYAMSVWADQLESDVTIQVGVSFDPLGGSAQSADLGLGGPTDVFRDFAGAPIPNTWYPAPLADKLAGQDLAPGELDIRLQFSSDVDGPQVLGSNGFYYGLTDDPATGDVWFLDIALHELAHGLGFTTFINLSSGAKFQGKDDSYLLHLQKIQSSAEPLALMTDAQRAAAVRSGLVYWTGPAVAADSTLLTAGSTPAGDVEMFAPSALMPLTSIVHFDPTLTPDQVQEPYYVSGFPGLQIARAVLADIGWGSTAQCAPIP